MRLPRPDLRLRIAVAFATLCIVVVGALGVTLYRASEDMERALVEELVAEEMEALVERSSVAGAAVPGGGPNLQYYVLRAPQDYAALKPALRNLTPGHHEVGSEADELHVVVRDIGGTRYVVTYDSGPHEAREARFRRLALLALGAVALLAPVLGYGLARLLTRQLTQLATDVAKLAPDAPHAPLERADHDAEVAALARALDAYHARIVDMVRREQEFTANASHELRTPLTGIRTSCELLEADGALSEKSRARVDMIGSAARQMTERIDALLLLARKHQRDEVEKVALRRCVEEVALPYAEEIARKGLSFDVQIAESERLELNRKALELVLGNLVRNAVRYTQRGGVRVTWEARRLTIADTGTGIAAEHLPQLFERYYRAAADTHGLGLGLAIVRRICDDLGWKIQVESTPGRGSSFSIVFP